MALGFPLVGQATIAGGVERASELLLVRRQAMFAVGWLATTTSWLAVFVVEDLLSPAGALAHLAIHAAILAGLAVASRRPVPAIPVRVLTCAACLALGWAVIALTTLVGAPGDVLAFVLLTLYLLAAVGFAWGWRLELVLLAGTMVPWLLVPGTFLVTPAELVTAVAVGTALALATAEAVTRSFRSACRRREHAEEVTRELAISRNAYRDMAENARDVIWASDVEGRVTYLNEAGARLFGGWPSDHLGRHLREFETRHPRNPPVEELLARLVAGETLPPMLVQMPTVGGPRWLEILVSLVRAPDGRPMGIRGISRDVHDRVVAEERLRASEERYRTIVESELAAFVRIDVAGRITYVNEYVCRLVGRGREELLGTPVLDILHPDDHAAAHAAITASATPPYRAPTIEDRVRTVAGWRWFEWTGGAMLDQEGRIIELQALGFDIDERRRTEERLRASEARYRGLVECQEELVVRFAPDGRITFANEACEKVFGRRREDMLGEVLPLIHPDDLPAVVAAIERVREPPHRGSLELREYTPAGVRWFEWDAVAVHEAGALVEFQAVGRDVTDRRAAQEALQRSLDELTRSQEQLRLLAQRQVLIREHERKRLGLDLHDDVCQELVGIGIMLESIRRRLGPISAENAAEFDRVGRYLNQLIDHLRLLARELQPLQLRDLGLEGSLRSLTKGMSSESCRVDALFPTEVPRLGEEMEVAVYRIAQEALTNAVRHADAAMIDLMLAVISGNLCLEVSDDGRGFDPGDRSNALGLISMEERAQSLGGRLLIWSRLGEGTTIRLECPLGGRESRSAA